MKYFCTYFDKNYLPQGMALYESLRSLKFDFTLFIVCLNDGAYDILTELNIPEIKAVKLSEIEAFDPEFAKCRDNRSIIEYYFTLSPVMPLYLFEKYPEIDILAYMDADLFFYSSPQALYDELGDGSVLIIEHRFPEKIKWREKYGRFNVQFQLYRRDDACFECLNWWRESCIEYCSDKLDGERFADQKYLDKWPEKFSGLVISRLKGAGLAPWNWYNYDIKLNDSGELKIDGEDLIFYHFQGFKILNRLLLNHNLGHYRKVMPYWLLRELYLKYLRKVVIAKNKINKRCKSAGLSVFTQHNRAGISTVRTIASGFYHRALMFINEEL